MAERSAQLAELIDCLSGLVQHPELTGNAVITGIGLDSRLVQAGYIFVALSGGTSDGHQFIPQAVRNGAAAVVGSQKLDFPMRVPYVQVSDSRLALAQLSAAFYGFPGRKMKVVGVTGTDGKTTTTNLIYSILRAAGARAGMISTVHAVIGEETIDTGFHVTTPDAPVVQEMLARMAASGTTHVVLEATSHGLDQKRVACCEFDVAVITNITHEHLDYHGTYENYFASKATLIRELARTVEKQGGNARLAVFNRDDISFPLIEKLLTEHDLASIQHTDYGMDDQSDFRATNIVTTADGLTFTICHQHNEWAVTSRLVGQYNVSNILAAFSAAVAGLGIAPQDALQGIGAMQSVAGRMEKVDLGQDFSAIVDFAHTPNALKVALQAARQMTKGRVIAIFGSAGLRDRAKRRMMAEVAVQLADVSIFTAEDPRTEKLEDILAEMKKAAIGQGGVEGETFMCVPDRGEAICRAVNMAVKNDLIMACGKGHEQSMCFGEIEYAWDDRTALRAALAERLGIAGEKMPYLPTQP